MDAEMVMYDLEEEIKKVQKKIDGKNSLVKGKKAIELKKISKKEPPKPKKVEVAKGKIGEID